MFGSTKSSPCCVRCIAPGGLDLTVKDGEDNKMSSVTVLSANLYVLLANEIVDVMTDE